MSLYHLFEQHQQTAPELSSFYCLPLTKPKDVKNVAFDTFGKTSKPEVGVGTKRKDMCKSVPSGAAILNSNPSKRHRERLNTELDRLAAILPFDSAILSKLDKLSILRLTVSYIRIKAYFQALKVGMDRDINGEAATKNESYQMQFHNIKMEHLKNHKIQLSFPIYHHRMHSLIGTESEAELISRAMNGFLLILNARGEIFYVSEAVENFLGFHQSDILHQSAYELVHSEDREELRSQMALAHKLNKTTSNLGNVKMERLFSTRFRCLLDNTSGFVRLDIRGKIKKLDGISSTITGVCESGMDCDFFTEPIINFRTLRKEKLNVKPCFNDRNGKFGENIKYSWGLFAMCSPATGTSTSSQSLDSKTSAKEINFKSKNKMDLSITTIEQRGKSLLGINEVESNGMSLYKIIHPDDLEYVTMAHQELLRSGSASLNAYRVSAKVTSDWQWLQTSFRMTYKNGKFDSILSSHKPLLEEEGRDLFGKRKQELQSATICYQVAPVPVKKQHKYDEVDQAHGDFNNNVRGPIDLSKKLTKANQHPIISANTSNNTQHSNWFKISTSANGENRGETKKSRGRPKGSSKNKAQTDKYYNHAMVNAKSSQNHKNVTTNNYTQALLAVARPSEHTADYTEPHLKEYGKLWPTFSSPYAAFHHRLEGNINSNQLPILAIPQNYQYYEQCQARSFRSNYYNFNSTPPPTPYSPFTPPHARLKLKLEDERGDSSYMSSGFQT